MNLETDDRQLPDVNQEESRSMSATKRGMGDVDAWLRRNVRACSLQEYRRYREFLGAEVPADDSPETV
ncbi:MAG: hypothetical protein ACK5JE_12055 [Castellaniella sp.]|uniref:hypothetical protein n=1 Tax=Castellaniella sp. TaxID=1955812 RepID=UPI003A86FFEA